MMGYNSTIRIDELFMNSSSYMNFKIIMPSERQTKQEYILCNSMYIKFQKNASDLQWPKQIQWSPETSRGRRWEGGSHGTWRNLGMIYAFSISIVVMALQVQTIDLTMCNSLHFLIFPFLIFIFIYLYDCSRS